MNHPARRTRAQLASLLAFAALAGCAVTPPAAVPPSPVAAASAPAASPAASAPVASAAASAPDAAASAVAASTDAAADEATPVAAPIDPLRPDRHIEPDDALAKVDLWARLRQGFAIPDLDDDYVRRAEQWYAARPDYVARMTERASRYLFHILEEVEKRGMPTELALLPFVESAFNPQAMSVAKASGMWQFIPSTGKNFDLKQNVFRDDRRDVLASTRAALDYLGRLHDMFGDWQLALAAYNWGEGNVQRAIARNQRAGRPTDYASLRMPEETRNYVPKLQAVKNIVLHPETYSLALPAVENHPYFLSVPIERDIDVELAASLAGLPLDEFRTLNPQLNRPVILAAGTPQVLLPYDNANAFVRGLRRHKGPTATWTAWVAPKTMRPREAAQLTGTDEATLRSVNRIPPKMLVKAGSTLLVARAAHKREDVSEHIADNALMVLAPDVPPGRRVVVKVGKRGTSVVAIARRYRVSAQQVAQWNGVGATQSFRAGQAVVVYMPSHSVHTVRAAAADRGKAARHAARSRSGPRRIASGSRDTGG
ncbi:MAG TPA: transglycosylase SLT domain-containing protein [Ideonella sp.]|nr:transglycosylase SLT domain-containing protein [Ideonella sp.]